MDLSTQTDQLVLTAKTDLVALLPADVETDSLEATPNLPEAVDAPIKAGDVIEVKEANRTMQRFKDIAEVTAGRLTPEWVDVDKENFKGTVSTLPKRDQIDVPVDEMQIVELYSK